MQSLSLRRRPRRSRFEIPLPIAGAHTANLSGELHGPEPSPLDLHLKESPTTPGKLRALWQRQ